MSAVLWGALIVWLGVGILPYLVVQAIVRLLAARGRQLHGALRHAAPAGRPARQGTATSGSTPSHSWNSNNIATNVLLYHLQRHSDHHANPTRRYQTLRDFEESPVLPTGYAGMMVLALVPPLYRRLMDHRVVAHFDGDLTLANLQPGKRDKLLAKYPPAAAPMSTPVDGRCRRPGTARPSRPRSLAARCPGCGYTYDVAVGNEFEGFAGRHGLVGHPARLVLPRLRGPRRVDFVPVEKVDAS